MYISKKDSINQFIPKNPTITFPFLETNLGSISQTNSILYYLAKKYKKDLFLNPLENAKINQWIEFENCKINNRFINDYIKILENELTNKDYIEGNKNNLTKYYLIQISKIFHEFSIPRRKEKYINA